MDIVLNKSNFEMLIIIDCSILIRSCFKVSKINELNNLLKVK